MAEIGKTVLEKGWIAARSTEISLTGIELTTTNPPSAPNSPWMDAVVPGTVLATLVKNKVIPDPFYGLENESIIDIADSGREYYTFWFFTTFQCKLSVKQHVDLNFRAINYSAEVYINGHKKSLPKGMFQRHVIDITDILDPDGQNLLAVLVHPPDHPGKIPPEGGQGGDHEIGKDVATQYVEGWDWMAPIRLFQVNGEEVFICGGNWILSDGLLRLSKKRYETDIKFHADMNFNMLRCWGGGLAERPDFYHYCDIYGLLVWQEFWITGDVDGRGDPISNPNGPLDHDLFLHCARDTVKLLRNHPSLALWVGGNEQVPPDDINTALKNDLKLHPHFENLIQSSMSSNEEDPSQYLDGTRIYIQGSMWDGFANGKGDFTDGPYEIQNPESFFSDDFYQYGFNPEVGSVGMPVTDTIRATMPKEGWEIPLFKMLGDGYVEEVPNPIWEYHKYIPYSKPSLVHDQILMYGIPKDLDDFCLQHHQLRARRKKQNGFAVFVPKMISSVEQHSKNTKIHARR